MTELPSSENTNPLPTAERSIVAALSGAEKAAVVVRALLGNGGELSLKELEDHLQAGLIQRVAKLPQISGVVEQQILKEFLSILDHGAYHGSGLRGALSLMEGSISSQVADELTKGQVRREKSDPWSELATYPASKIASVLANESNEVAAICLSKLDGPIAAQVLTAMPGSAARNAAYFVSKISAAKPEVVEGIGKSILKQVQDEPVKAFKSDPAELVGSILISAKARMREEILDGLRSEDEEFATRVRDELFVFGDIAERIETTAIPKIIREIEPDQLATAIRFSKNSGEKDAKTADYILENMSKRMAAAVREEVDALSNPAAEAGEAAQGAIVQAIQKLNESKEITIAPRVSSADGPPDDVQ